MRALETLLAIAAFIILGSSAGYLMIMLAVKLGGVKAPAMISGGGGGAAQIGPRPSVGNANTHTNTLRSHSGQGKL